MSDVGDKGKRVELTGALAGHYIRIDVDMLDIGVFEDLESKQIARVLDVFARLILVSDLPHGHNRAGLRKLKPAQFGVLCNLLPELIEVPKPS